MSKYTVMVTDYVFADFDQERKILAEVDAELKIAQCKTIAELKPQVRGVHGLLNTYLAGIGAPVFDVTGRAVAGIGITGVLQRDTPSGFGEWELSAIRCAGRISADIGYVRDTYARFEYATQFLKTQRNLP